MLYMVLLRLITITLLKIVSNSISAKSLNASHKATPKTKTKTRRRRRRKNWSYTTKITRMPIGHFCFNTIYNIFQQQPFCILYIILYTLSRHIFQAVPLNFSSRVTISALTRFPCSGTSKERRMIVVLQIKWTDQTA